MNVLPQLLELTQVIHISGQLDWQEVELNREKLTNGLSERYRPYAYLHEQMGDALSAADLALSRAGASSLGELPLFGLPAILVPYPYAWRYQLVNAQHLVKAGAAVLLKDGDLAAVLLPTARDLFSDSARRGEMRQKMQLLAQPGAARAIADALIALEAGAR
jgi:UDP-N-acetylglucosamine--N-acetylmuramyl-(pentapeptide) pyrophosphoryl-undecaprenol N-acetylglucosamine transferase